MTEFYLKFHHSIQKYFFSKQQNKLILAINLLISKPWVVLKNSAVSMTSTDMITSVASMTSTASLASKKQQLYTLYILSYFPYIRNLSSLNDLNSLNNLSNLNDLNSLISSKDLLSLMFSSILAPKWPVLMSQCGMGHQRPIIFMDLWQSFCWRLWRPWILILTKSKGHK